MTLTINGSLNNSAVIIYPTPGASKLLVKNTGASGDIYIHQQFALAYEQFVKANGPAGIATKISGSTLEAAGGPVLKPGESIALSFSVAAVLHAGTPNLSLTAEVTPYA